MTAISSTQSRPTAGWQCTDVLDLLREGYFPHDPGTCERCGRDDLRFLHRMEHDECSTVLVVGSECAKRLSSGCYDPHRCERRLANRWRRRQRFPGHLRWKLSGKGNEYIRIGGYIVTIFPSHDRPDRFTYCIAKDNFTDFSVLNFRTVTKAKLAAFDTVCELSDFQS